MTPGAINSTERDLLFSQALRQHAHCLDLTELMSVGYWSFGQGVRRAHENRFFWDLSSTGFNPFGLNHPVVLRTLPNDTYEHEQNFGKDIIALIPALADWRWTLIGSDHPLLKIQDSTFLQETSVLSSPLGWNGLEKINQLRSWSVQVSPNTYFFASRDNLPSEHVKDPASNAWIKLFLTLDILGPEGRLADVREQLHSHFPNSRIIGTQVVLSHSSPASLLAKGLKVDILSSDQIRLCFPISFLNSDLEGVKSLLAR